MKLLLIGLGNIGAAYVHTRHNIGFMVVDHLAIQQNVGFSTDRLAYITSFDFNNHKVYMIKPTTYMNDSGKAVKYWLNTLKIPIEQSLTIVDDITLPFGTIRLRAKGSDAGHNGLKSIAHSLGVDAYPRLRVGIGNHFPKGMLAEFVLGNFLPIELEGLPLLLEHTKEILITWCKAGMVHTMNQFNKVKTYQQTTL
ncbi:aminoacyl-tRNA hydrolase [Cardinium endosymbiont of Culicoides punctatus]|uniref:aminoacyl-tRNA hydrolase n=1 Tax=Cardinium endosymbiont of Culicoides punctatus TaxID=2304601 RepID=UPI001058B7EB|nr:aminoacyl-tRNA hydrolase [Cardinium endosymbiont of Culicoides punctatus]TDG95679.1 Peptidyl-tRNA hydrolase [Cardinium endosymbiont of Culicoides punctatus]